MLVQGVVRKRHKAGPWKAIYIFFVFVYLFVCLFVALKQTKKKLTDCEPYVAVIVDGAVPEDCDGAGVLQCGYPFQPDQHDDSLINDNLNSM